MDKVQNWIAILVKRGFAYDNAQRPKYCRVIGDGGILEIFVSGKYIRVSECSETHALFEIYPGPSKSAFYKPGEAEFSKTITYGEITERLKKL
jgi:hypothetical protein